MQQRRHPTLASSGGSLNGMRFSVNVSCVASAAEETTNVRGGFRSNSFPMASMKLLSLVQEACATTVRA